MFTNEQLQSLIEGKIVGDLFSDGCDFSIGGIESF